MFKNCVLLPSIRHTTRSRVSFKVVKILKKKIKDPKCCACTTKDNYGQKSFVRAL